LNKLKFIELNDTETLQSDLVVRSIGYKNVNIDESVPFDKKLGVVSNVGGKVIGKDGLYCTGWIKRGPRGVIVDTTSDAYETAQQLCNDLFSIDSQSNKQKQGGPQVEQLLKNRSVNFVDKNGWSKIDAEEIRRGQLVGKPREKINSVEEMLKVAFGN
jgi:adrenodoxin-NADP+ reductase